MNIKQTMQKDIVILTILFFVAIIPRFIVSISQGWLAEDVFFIDFINTWFVKHFSEYFFQFQHVNFPPRSPEFGTPPLALWIESLGMYIGNKLNIDVLTSARSVNVIFGSITTILVYFIGNRWFNKTTGIIAGFAVAVTPTIIAINASAHVDTILAFFILADLYVFFLFIENRNNNTLIILAVLLGLSMLTKIYAIVMILMISIFFLIEKNPQKISVRKFIIFFIMIILTIMTLWAGARDPDHIERTISKMVNIGSLSFGVGSGGIFSEYDGVTGYTNKSILYNFFMIFGRSLPIISIIFFFFVLPLSIYKLFVYIKKRKIDYETLRIFFILSIIFVGILSIHFFGGPQAVANRIIFIMILVIIVSSYLLSIMIKELKDLLKTTYNVRRIEFVIIAMVIFLNGMSLIDLDPKFYNAYNNVLIGGVRGGSEIYRVGHGEGLEIAGQWIMNNTLDNARICALRVGFIDKYLKNRTMEYCPLNKNLDFFISQGSEYIILHNSFMSGGLKPPILDDVKFLNITPEFTIHIGDYPYINIYKIPIMYEEVNKMYINNESLILRTKSENSHIEILEKNKFINFKYDISKKDWVYAKSNMSIPINTDGMEINIFGDGNNETFYLDLGKSQYGYMRYMKKINWIGWQKFYIPFSSMDMRYNRVGLSDVDYIKLSIDTTNNVNGELIIGDMFTLKKKEMK